MNRQLTPSQSLFTQVRRDIMASMETGNMDRARLVLNEYTAAVQDSATIVDMSEDLRTDIIAAYGVAI